MKKILLHICCGPCLIHPFESLKEKGFAVSGFYYNPNIHPFTEYKSRLSAVSDLVKKEEFEISFPEYFPQDFFRAVNENEQAPDRCRICWGLRLKKTAKEAKEKGFDYFTTTLLVSPYQNQDELKKIGFEAAEEAGSVFYYEDFRPGFRAAQKKAKKDGIYCQKYCGCIYSEMERYKDKRQEQASGKK